jgi:hypothetical protein
MELVFRQKKTLDVIISECKKGTQVNEAHALADSDTMK